MARLGRDKPCTTSRVREGDGKVRHDGILWMGLGTKAHQKAPESTPEGTGKHTRRQGHGRTACLGLGTGKDKKVPRGGSLRLDQGTEGDEKVRHGSTVRLGMETEGDEKVRHTAPYGWAMIDLWLAD
eukprot:354043-Chlamydomonas_euryale.AAC.4